MGRAQNSSIDEPQVLKRGRKRPPQLQHTLLSPTPSPESLLPLEAAITDIDAGLTEKAQKLLGRYRGQLENGYAQLDRLADAVCAKLLTDNGGEMISGYARRQMMLLGIEPSTDRDVAFTANHGNASKSHPRLMHLRHPDHQQSFRTLCGRPLSPAFVRRGLWDALSGSEEVEADTLELYRRCKSCEAKAAKAGYKPQPVRFNPLSEAETRQLRRAALFSFVEASGNLLSVAASTQEGFRQALGSVLADRLAAKPASWWAREFAVDSICRFEQFFKLAYGSELQAMPAPSRATLEEILGQLPLATTMHELITPGEVHGSRQVQINQHVFPKLLGRCWPDALEQIGRELCHETSAMRSRLTTTRVLPYRDRELLAMAETELRGLYKRATAESGPVLNVRRDGNMWAVRDIARDEQPSRHAEKQAAIDLASYSLRRRPAGGLLVVDDGDEIRYRDIAHDPAA